MTPRQTINFFMIATVVLLVLIVIVGRFAPQTSSLVTGTTGALGIITAGAIGIERILEAFWTFIGLTRGAWWPLGPLSREIQRMVDDLDRSVEPFYADAEKAILRAAQVQRWTDLQLEAARKELRDLKARGEELRSLAPDSQRIQLIAASYFQSISYLEKKYPELRNTAVMANQAITGVSDFIATFKDNPGRRLISIYAGSLIGLVVAGVLGLDVFQAVSDSPATVRSGDALPRLGVVVTGILIGLGSNPTHEVIRAIQEIKKSRKSDNDPAPVIVPVLESGMVSASDLPQSDSPVPSSRVPQRSSQVNTFSLRRNRQ